MFPPKHSPILINTAKKKAVYITFGEEGLKVRYLSLTRYGSVWNVSPVCFHYDIRGENTRSVHSSVGDKLI